MQDSIRKYLSAIGKIGGKKSRRKLSSAEAKDMVRVREARKAFKRFATSCFWYSDPNYKISRNDIDWVASELKKYGSREAWNIAQRLTQKT